MQKNVRIYHTCENGKNMLVCRKRQKKNNLYVKMARYITCIVKRSKYTEHVCEKSKIKPILLHS